MRQRRHGVYRIRLHPQLDAVAGQVFAILLQDAAFGAQQDVFQVLLAQWLADYPHGEAAHELRLEAVVNEVARLGHAQVLHVLRLAGLPAGEPDGRLGHPVTHLLGQPVESAAHDEQDVPRVDRPRAGGLAALHVHQRLELPQDIRLAEEADVRLLHQLEQVDLHSAPGDVPPPRHGLSGDLVHFVEEHDAVLSQSRVVIRGLDQVADQVLDVVSHVARSENFVASAFTNGTPISRAMQRMRYVLPTPVGPRSRMLCLLYSRSWSSGCSMQRRTWW